MKILLAMDGSDASLNAAKCLRSLQKTADMEVVVCTAIGLPKESLTSSHGPAYQEFVSESLRQEATGFEKVKELFQETGSRVRQMVRYGHIGHCIVSAAEENEVNLIVMGSKGTSENDRVLLGSISEYVALHAVGSVLVVRPNARLLAVKNDFHITISCDGSPASDQVVQRVKSHPWGKGLRVDVVSVVPIHTTHPIDSPAIPHTPSDADREKCIRVADSVVADLKSAGLQAAAHVLEAEHIGQQVVDFANTSGSELIMLGARGQNGVARALLGSVSHYILRNATQSVWVVREEPANELE